MISKEVVLKAYHEALPTGAVLGFFENHRPLSNFHVESFVMGGLTWPTSEHAYQFAKIEVPTDDLYEEFLRATPGKAKKLGRLVPLREHWPKGKHAVMQAILEHKFKQCPVARKCLIETTGPLVEVNWWGDTYWGMCDLKGENHLGKILMTLRHQIQEGKL